MPKSKIEQKNVLSDRLKDKDVIFTTGQVAKLCNVAPRTVAKWFDSGLLKGYRIPGSKDRRVPAPELVRFMRNHDIPLDLNVEKTYVLIVNDDPEIITTLVEKLNENGRCEIKLVGNIFDAGFAAHQFQPHIIFLDIMLLEDIDPKLICGIIRKNLQNAHIAAITSKLSETEKQILLNYGFNDCLYKPLSPDQIIDHIHTLINNKPE